MQAKDVLRKVRALLARADEQRNDNAHEREIAMRQANALLEKHNLSMAEIAEPAESEVDESLIPVDSAKWRLFVWSAICQLTSTRSLVSGRGARRKIILIGTLANRTAASYLAGYVFSSIEREGARYAKAAKRMGFSAREAGGSFRRGAAAGVIAQVRSILSERAAAANKARATSGKDLVVVMEGHREAARDYALKNYGENAVKARRERIRGGSGYRLGHAYGRGLGLHRQVGGQSQAPLLK